MTALIVTKKLNSKSQYRVVPQTSTPSQPSGVYVIIKSLSSSVKKIRLVLTAPSVVNLAAPIISNTGNLSSSAPSKLFKDLFKSGFVLSYDNDPDCYLTRYDIKVFL